MPARAGRSGDASQSQGQAQPGDASRAEQIVRGANLASNTQRITLVSFLSYFVMSGILSQMGIIAAPMAAHYDVELTTITATFSYLTVAIGAGVFIGLFVFDYLKIKWVFLLVYPTIIAAVATLYLERSIAVLPSCLAAIGASCGLGLTAGAVVITLTYSAERRASMLIVTDLSYSIAGFVISFLVVRLLAHQLHWTSGYVSVAAVAALIIAIAAVSSFPHATRREHREDGLQPDETWPPSVFLCCVALLFYLLGQNTLMIWLPNYMQAALDLPKAEAGEVVSSYWLGMAAGQIATAWLVLRTRVHRLVILAATVSGVAALPFSFLQSPTAMFFCAFALGASNGGILKLMIAFGSQFFRFPTPRLICFLLFSTTLGTSASPTVSTWIVDMAGMRVALQFAALAYGVTAAAVAMAYLFGTSRLNAVDDEVRLAPSTGGD